MADSFEWDGKTLYYFDHPYNHTRLNMRRVEIPVARWYIAQALGAPRAPRILEVGNVLSHYGPVSWPVLDLREKGCINRDVMTWKPTKPVDLLVSISTVEHVRARPSMVLMRLRSFLAPGGLAVVTVPTAYRVELDSELVTESTGADRVWAMCVIPGTYNWAECTLREALAQQARACFGRWSGGLVVMELKRDA